MMIRVSRSPVIKKILISVFLSISAGLSPAWAVDFPPFVFIGDFGATGTGEQGTPEAQLDVSTLTDSLIRASDGAIIVTSGDNNYSNPYSCDSFQSVVGDYYGDFLPDDALSMCNELMPISSPVNQSNDCSSESDVYNPYCDACFVDNLSELQFFPVPGNHDTDGNTAQNGMTKYLSYFHWARQACAHTACDADAITESVAPELQGIFACSDISTPAYYDVLKTDGHFFFLDSNCNGNEQDVVSKCKNTPLSCKDPDFYANATQCEKNYCGQQLWLEYAMSQSPATYKIVSFHHPPYSTGKYPSCQGMQADYAAMGATTVLSGHTHYIERLNLQTNDDELFVYYSNGAGGAALDTACTQSGVIAKPGTGTLLNALDLDKTCSSQHAFGLIYGRKLDGQEGEHLLFQTMTNNDNDAVVVDSCTFSANGETSCEIGSNVVPDSCVINADGTTSREPSGACSVE